jgi:medium-chain acyl-[acyl-carrier-protein] hydrolase
VPREVSPRRLVSFAQEDWVATQLLQQRRPDTVALFCFAFAGAGASVFRGWPELAPATVLPLPVQLPGRENRWLEPAYTELSRLVVTLASVLRLALRPPFALFGHSMGALIAFELARELRRLRRPSPIRLFVSGCRAPHIADPDPPLSALPQAELLDELRRLSSVPHEVLQNEEMVELVMPTLRADFQICDTYVWRAEEPLDCPISAFGGSNDKKARRLHVGMWRTHTQQAFVERLLPGDHLFLVNSKAALVDAIAADLAATSQPPAVAGR